MHHFHIAQVGLYRSTRAIEYAFIHAESTSGSGKIMRHKCMNFHCKKTDVKAQPPVKTVTCARTSPSLHISTEIKAADILEAFRST